MWLCRHHVICVYFAEVVEGRMEESAVCSDGSVDVNGQLQRREECAGNRACHFVGALLRKMRFLKCG